MELMHRVIDVVGGGVLVLVSFGLAVVLTAKALGYVFTGRGKGWDI